MLVIQSIEQDKHQEKILTQLQCVPDHITSKATVHAKIYSYFIK